MGPSTRPDHQPTNHTRPVTDRASRRLNPESRAWQTLSSKLGGPNTLYESPEKITDVWCLPTSTGQNGHGAEFPLALAGRCIALTSRKGDLVLDPFVGSGTSAVAATELGRRYLGFDISEEYIGVAEQRVARAIVGRQTMLDEDAAGMPTLAGAQLSSNESRSSTSLPARNGMAANTEPKVAPNGVVVLGVAVDPGANLAAAAD